jgi:membrane-associated phospholipid phosphatase
MKFRLGMTILLAAAASLYFPLNKLLTGGFNLSTPLDAWVPIWPIWVIPYLLCPPAWAFGLIWAAMKMDEPLFRSFISAGLFILLSAAMFFYVFPTYVQRPVLVSDGWAAQILQMVYQNDGAYNAFPSGHVYQTSLFCLFFNRLYPNHSWFWTGLVIIVVLSTLFTGQHNLVDPLGGLAIAWVGYRFGLYLVPQNQNNRRGLSI